MENDITIYTCPFDNTSLKLSEDGQKYISENGRKYDITNGLPDFTWPKELSNLDQHEKEVYEKLAADYDKYASIPFKTFKSDEYQIREEMIDKLNLNTDSKTLEVGCGDGRGAEHIAKRLGKNGSLYLQELSPAFMNNAIKRLKPYENATNLNYSIASAMHLSFPDDFFDSAHHFGGVSTFSDVKQFLKEMTRVVKPGGKIVIGDESMGLWLRNTEYGKIMMNSNPLFKYEIPYSDIPVEARNVKIEWIMLDAFFILEFEVGVGEPEANYFVPIPSQRGGNHWRRYYGNLEGVTDDTKKLAFDAIKKNGTSMSDWLENIVSEAAKKELNK